MLLNDPTLIDRYAQGIYQMYQRWSDYAHNQRRMMIEELLKSIASSANLLMPQIVWKQDGSSFFRISEWEIHASLSAVELDPTAPGALKGQDWLHKVTSPYHELRHADQHRVILEAYMTRAVAVPVLFTANAAGGYLGKTLEDEGYPYPRQVVQYYRYQKGEYQPAWTANAQAWSDSFYGQHGQARQQTMNTLMTRGLGSDYGAYRALAEEADAFAVQKQVKTRIKSLIHTVDDNLNLAELFG